MNALIGLGALTSGCLIGLMGNRERPDPRADDQVLEPVEHDLHGGLRDVRSEVELLPNAPRGFASLQVSVDNATKESVTLVNAVQVLDGHQHDVAPAVTQDASVAQANSHTRGQPVKIDLSGLKDGYYEIMVQTLAATTESDSKRYLSSHLYVAVEGGDARTTDFYEWYQNSGASELTITDQRIGSPVGDMRAFAEQLVKGER